MTGRASESLRGPGYQLNRPAYAAHVADSVVWSDREFSSPVRPLSGCGRSGLRGRLRLAVSPYEFAGLHYLISAAVAFLFGLVTNYC